MQRRPREADVHPVESSSDSISENLFLAKTKSVAGAVIGPTPGCVSNRLAWGCCWTFPQTAVRIVARWHQEPEVMPEVRAAPVRNKSIDEIRLDEHGEKPHAREPEALRINPTQLTPG